MSSVQVGFGSRYHCCASCRHFSVAKQNGRLLSRCLRLGYETNPKYQFNCWDPKERVQERMRQSISPQSEK